MRHIVDFVCREIYVKALEKLKERPVWNSYYCRISTLIAWNHFRLFFCDMFLTIVLGNPEHIHDANACCSGYVRREKYGKIA